VSEPTRVRLPILRVLGVAMITAVALGLGVQSAGAQVLYGSVVGNVTDAQGAAIPGATVTISSKDTGFTRDTTSGNDGAYSIINLQAGVYELKVALQGFREFVRTGVPIAVGQISRVEVSLEVGALSETVTVASAVELLQTDKSSVNTELKAAEIAAMPLNQYRNYQALVNLVPGATPARFNNAETDTPARSLTAYVNGQSSYQNTTRTDGATNVNIWLPNHSMMVSSAETVDTVSVSTSNFDAEQGQSGGAAITVVTKSGTNEFKGSAFEFYNSEKLNASPYYFGGATSGKPDKLPVTRNIYGGTVGGPVKKNRLFFFGSFEGYKQTQNLFNFFNVPTQALRSGDFSQALNANGTQQIIYDPLTGNADGTGRTPFPGNVIPAERINPIARAILAQNFYPLPNTTGTGAGGLTGNFQRPEKRTSDRKNYDVKVNWNRTSSHQIWGKFAYMDALVDDRTYFLIPDPDGSGDGGSTKVTAFTTGHTWTLNPTTVLDSTFGFQRQDQNVLGPDQNSQVGNFGTDVLGIPGTNSQGGTDSRYFGYPRFDTGFSVIGNFEGWMPIYRDERTYSFATNMTKIKGNHEFRGGYLVNFMYLDHWQPETDNPRGRLDFTTRSITALRGGQTNNFYNQWAAFLLGMPGTVSKSVQAELMTGREWQHAMFFRDRWTVGPKVTLDLGLRWEYYPIMHRADRGIERLDLSNLNVILGGRGGNPDNVGLEAGKGNFAPRVGLVYRMNEETVFRTGYGVTYNPIAWSRPMRGSHYPVTIASQYFNANTFQPYGTLQQGIPIIPVPDQSSGQVPLDRAAFMRTPEVGNIDRGTIQTWNLTVERRLPMGIAVDVGYVGAKGDGGYADLDINAPQEIGVGDAGRPYASMGRLIAVNLWGQRLKTRYHGLQVGVNRPFTKGLLLKGAYTFSKAMNQADDDGWTGVSYNTLSQYDRNYARAGFDRKHNLQMAFVYQLPWKSDNGYGNIGKALISDWQLNGVFGIFTGVPFSVTANGAVLNTPSNLVTADQVGDPNKVGEVGASGVYYDPSAWLQPVGVRFGTSGRNSLRGPGGVNLDGSLFRSFSLGGQRRLEVRVEAINVTNTPKFNNPTADVNSGSFMRITGVNNVGGASNWPERQIRLGLRFQF
jgi:hypothetical protein